MSIATAKRERVAQRQLLRDPVRFSRRLMRADTWAGQNRILNAVDTKKRIAVKACHASGKTYAAALAACWWITRYPNGFVVTTAPTWKLVEKVLWGNIRKAISNSQLNFPKPNLTELQLGDDNYILGLSTNEADRFSGFHGPHVLMILDEAPGVRALIYEAIEGIRAGGDVRVLCIGNPVIASGPFYEAFSTQVASWCTQTISAFETPNLANLLPNGKRAADYSDERLVSFLAELGEDELDYNVRNYLTTRRWVWEKWDEWGRHHNPLWDARVMGRFPKQSTDSLFPLLYLEQAAARDVNKKKRHRPRVGIDVAGPGEDETVMYVVEGPNILQLEHWNDPDPRGKVLNALRPWKMRDPVVNVDSVGMGHYFAAHIEDAGYTVNRINVGQKDGVDKERFINLKAQLHWALRERFEEGNMNALHDERTLSQLASLKYKHDSQGRVVVRSKKEMRADGIKSPDRAEALMLAYASSGSASVEMV